jgi:hypothetical protein
MNLWYGRGGLNVKVRNEFCCTWNKFYGIIERVFIPCCWIRNGSLHRFSTFMNGCPERSSHRSSPVEGTDACYPMLSLNVRECFQHLTFFMSVHRSPRSLTPPISVSTSIFCLPKSSMRNTFVLQNCIWWKIFETRGPWNKPY